MASILPKYLLNIFDGVRSMIRPTTPNRPGGSYIPQDASMDLDPVYQWFQKQMELGYDRNTRYAEYEAMDIQSTEVSSALDYYADDSTQQNREQGSAVWIECDSEEISAILSDLLYDRLEIEDHIWAIARSLSKHGDVFRKVRYDKPEDGHTSRGVTGWAPTIVRKMQRLENSKGQLVGFKQDAFTAYSVRQTSMKDMKTDPNRFYNPWDYIHFRILGDDDTEVGHLYGTSMLSSVRSVWKRLKLLEEALSIYRLTRAPDRLVFYVDVGDMPYQQATEVVRHWKRIYKKHQYINPLTQEYHQYLNPHSLDEDIYWPTRKDSGSRVDRLPGGADVNSIVDIEHFLNKIYLGLKIPREYLSGEGAAVIQFGGGQSLAQKDIRYARSVMRVQRGLIQGLTRICQIHLALLGYDPSPKRFQVKMSPISNLEAMQSLEILSTRVNTALSFATLVQQIEVDPFTAKDYILREILELSGDLVDRLLQPPTQPQPQNPQPTTEMLEIEKLQSVVKGLREDLEKRVTQVTYVTSNKDPLPHLNMTEEDLQSLEQERLEANERLQNNQSSGSERDERRDVSAESDSSEPQSEDSEIEEE